MRGVQHGGGASYFQLFVDDHLHTKAGERLAFSADMRALVDGGPSPGRAHVAFGYRLADGGEALSVETTATLQPDWQTVRYSAVSPADGDYRVVVGFEHNDYCVLIDGIRVTHEP